MRISPDRDHRNRTMAIAETGAWRSPKPGMAIAETVRPITEIGRADRKDSRYPVVTAA
jgi:hypothetical protein